MPVPTINAEVLLVNADYVKKKSQINGSVDDNFFNPAIVTAQDKWVEPFLGTALMNKLKSDDSGSGATGAYSTLLETYVRKVVSAWTVVEILPNLAYKVDNGTLVQYQSEQTTAVSDSVMKDIVGRATANARYYTKRMVDYLCDNSSSFPEYTQDQGSGLCPIKHVPGQFNYAFSCGNSAMSRTDYYTEIQRRIIQ